MTEPIKNRQEQLRQVTAEDIQETYKRGYITAKDRNDLLREKAHAVLAGTLQDQTNIWLGPMKVVLERSIHNLQEGWNNLKESVVREPTKGTAGEQVKGEAYYAGLAVWGQVQMVTSIFNAIGDVTGQVAENAAIKAGASPGLARIINVAVNLGTGFLPMAGLGSKSFAKTVQHMGKTSTATTIARGGKEGGETIGKAAPEISAELNKVGETLANGLKMEGVPEKYLNVMGFNEEGRIGIVGKIKAGEWHKIEPTVGAVHSMAGGAPEVVKSVSQQFLEDLTTFRTKMSRITKVQAHEETAAMAERLGLSLDDLKNVVPGQALNEKEMYAYLKALEPQVTKLIESAKAAITSQDPKALEDLSRNASELFTVAPIFRGAEVTAGRSVEILKETPPMKRLTDLLANWDPESIAKGDYTAAMQTFAEDIAALEQTPEKLGALVATSQSNWQRMGEVWWPRMREAYINLLLARPLTQVRNFVGNSVAAVNAVADRYAAGLFSLGGKDGIEMNEGTYLAKGMAWATREGMQQFAEAFKSLSPDDISKLDYIPHQTPGLLGRFVNSPGDMMRGMDNFFKTILRRGSYYAEAYRTAVERGMDGEALSTFIAERVNHPTQQMIARADDFALYQTFQNELGTLGKAAQKALQSGPLVTWFPFMKTPINLAKYAWNRTPGLQLLSKSLYQDILAGGARADLAIGRLTMSQLQAHFLFNLAQEGFITGSGPIDPQLRGSWLATHRPYSIRGEHDWYPLNNMEPGTTTMGLVADYAQIMNQLDDPTAEQGAMALTFAVMKNLSSKSYWQSISDLVDITSNLTRGEPVKAKALQVVTSPVTTVLTGGPLGSTTARIIDPIMRESRSFIDNIQSKVPGYSKDLPPVRDGYGDPILPPQTIGSKWLSYVMPFTSTPEQTDQVKIEGDKLHAKLPTFPWNIGGNVQEDFDIREPQPGDRYGVELTPQQRDRWQVIYKNIIRHKELGIEKQLLDNPMHQNSMPALQRENFEAYLRDAKSTALDALLTEDVGLHKKMLMQQAASQRPLLDLRQQGQMDQRLLESTDLLESLSREEQQNLLKWGILESEPTP